MRSGATVRRFSAWPGAAVQRFAASDAAPWPDAVASDPDGTPVRRAVPLPEAVRGGPWRGVAQDGPWREAAQGEPWREVAQDLPWRAVAQVGPLVQVARPFCAPGQTPRCSPRSWRRQEGILQSDRQAEA